MEHEHECDLCGSDDQVREMEDGQAMCAECFSDFLGLGDD
jgi:ribosomal protein L37AE/L43A